MCKLMFNRRGPIQKNCPKPTGEKSPLCIIPWCIYMNGPITIMLISRGIKEDSALTVMIFIIAFLEKFMIPNDETWVALV